MRGWLRQASALKSARTRPYAYARSSPWPTPEVFDPGIGVVWGRTSAMKRSPNPALCRF